ncbi:mammalian ependymin-related protein 1-like [Pecten maximus]|uniref:mammalian ependymin-related protein 1-like n=1 Tax=Pecten maximus TaxID=6579 RepID=UPI001458567C|nr:mammalian ependymin-related protein 1-like [Pecten maximus]
MKYLVILSALACVAYAQIPGPCQSPKQWEARVLTLDRSKNFTQFGKVSYDETQRRERIIEEVEFGSDRDYFDTLFLHNVGKGYILNLKTRKCNVTNLTEPFIPRGVPREAEFEGEATIGAAGVPGEFMVVENFKGTFRSTGAKFFGVSTVPDCMPIEFGYYSEKTGFVQQTMFDVNIGISDPNVFIPPKECL